MDLFEEGLQRLNEKILKMGCLVKEAIKNSIHALTDRNNVLARKVINDEHLIDALDVEIGEECIRLTALCQPDAIDIGFITTAMKVTSGLERMGDLAINIAERAAELNEEPEMKPYINILKMSDMAQGMTQDVLNAFVRRDAQWATDLIARVDEIDDLKVEVLKELSLLRDQDPNSVIRAMKISFIAQYLERIADHATNIAEMLIYLVKGKIIKHTDRTLLRRIKSDLKACK
jgi:phosphate transport system protein